MPTPALQLNRKPDGLYFTGDTLSYRITGLLPYNLERLRITLKACTPEADESRFHLDTLDLYHSRSRESYAESCTKYLKAQQSVVLADLNLLISALETERIAMRSRGKTQEQPPMTEEEKSEALEILRSKDLLKHVLSGFESLGYIGERINKLLGFIATVSRLLPDPLAVLFLSRPGAGKTQLQEAICKLTPPESVIQYTRLTGQSLFYRDQDALKNKVLAIEEEEGMAEAMYSIKTLISSQKLSVAATRTDAKTGKFSVDEYTVNGPVVVMVCTTNPDALDDETRQRFMILTIDETREQTEKILAAQRSKNTQHWYQSSGDEQSVARLHHTMQRLLKPLTVTFPAGLKIQWPYGMLQMRREQNKFLSLIKAITLLHQYQRKTGTLKRADGTKMAYVQATQQDVDTALRLGSEVFSRNIDDVSPTGRRLLKSVVALADEKYTALRSSDPDECPMRSQIPFTRKELRQRLGWSEVQVRRTLEHLVALGYLGRVNGRQGATCRYVLIDDGDSDPVVEFDMKAANEKSTG